MRRRIGDSDAQKWTRNSELDAELDEAAAAVSQEIDMLSYNLRATATTTINVVSGTLQYALPADFFRVRYVTLTLADGTLAPCTEIDELRESAGFTQGNGWNDHNGLFYYINIAEGADATAVGVHQFNLPVDAKQSHTLTVHYAPAPQTIATGTAGDLETYTAIPTEFHILVPLKAAIALLGVDPRAQAVSLEYASRLDLAIRSLAFRPIEKTTAMNDETTNAALWN